VDIDQIRVI